jgi:cytochrome c5
MTKLSGILRVKHKYLVAAFVTCTCYLFAAVPWASANSESASAEQISEGGDLYNEFCERCHEDPAAGLADFEGSREDLVERLEGMTEEMPDFWGLFTPDEITALYAYIQNSQQAD